ncbi:MAG: hypothetical protein Ct9H300mP6_00670 [Gammaproteobacteria bacterium]|nr:MAG: hypothetical protein Ct9H300mP6_00670 [Gammaproteobacteria bacterium]
MGGLGGRLFDTFGSLSHRVIDVWRQGISNHQWDQSTNIYASIGRGFKSGGFNLGTGLSIESFNDTLVYEPEYLWNYEIGVNHQFSE